MTEDDRKAYWRANLTLMAGLLVIWALVSLVASTLLVDWLNNVSLGSVPLGFWMGQQGSIITFVLLIAVYVWRMEKLDASYGIDEEAELAAGQGAPGGGAH
jgi:putative solute:sodium symporter small subunit